MATMMRRRSRRSAAQRPLPLGAAAQEYAAVDGPVCPGAYPSGGLDGIGLSDPGRSCSCDRVGCPAPGAHPASPTWQLQATVDSAEIEQWWETRPEANVIIATGRVFDVLDVPAIAGATALARMSAAAVDTGPVAVQGTERMLFYVATRGAPEDEDEWWSCGLDASPDVSAETGSLRWHCRDSFVLAPPSRYGTGQDVRWVRRPMALPSALAGPAPVPDTQLPDALRLLEYLVDACEEEG
jgi:hypothetical protein